MREIRFRQAIYDENGKFERFAYWGFIDNSFVGISTTNYGDNYLSNAEKRSEQYIGSKDKNGKEIYEGDIMRKGNSPYIGIVEYTDSCGFNIKINTKKGLRWYSLRYGQSEWDYWSNLEYQLVIGNIHQNPELLKETKWNRS